MYDFTTELIKLLVEKKDFTEFFRSKVEEAINKLLETELTCLLNYERYDREGFNSGNSRNGYYARILDTEYGRLNLRIPRDRNGEFENQTLTPYRRRNDTLEDSVILLYQNGMTTREIAEILERLYGHHYSPQTISNMTKMVEENLEAFHNRLLSKRYVVVYLDATYLPIRRDTVDKEAVYFVMGITLEGNKEILGYRIFPTESAHNWEILLQDLKDRGVEETLLFVTDGLTGIRDAIHRVFPKADHQACWVHLARNVSNSVRVKDRNHVLEDLKMVYKAIDLKTAKEAMKDFKSKWETIYPKVVKRFDDERSLFTFLNYPKAIRKAIYTTNSMENFNKHLKRFTKRKEQFPNEESLQRFIVTQADRFNYKHAGHRQKGFMDSRLALEKMFTERAA